MTEQLDINKPEFWEEIYQHGRAGWDLGGPTPVFERLIQSGEFKPGHMIVICAGRGHDAREFARHGYRVDAVEFAAEAADAMRAMNDMQNPVLIYQTDMFHLSKDLNGQYDYVLEYTCMCAIDPNRRNAYADLVTRLLKPGGIYIDLAFPTDRRKGGPPFAVVVDEILAMFTARGFKLLRREIPNDSVPQRKSNEELLIFQKTKNPFSETG
ncbi:MAG: methyltransferase domain-containing protein [Chloroflexi bacterium]|nr:methyltransferase domain-containing protein [Chloroflexota bacterium]